MKPENRNWEQQKSGIKSDKAGYADKNYADRTISGNVVKGAQVKGGSSPQKGGKEFAKKDQRDHSKGNRPF